MTWEWLALIELPVIVVLFMLWYDGRKTVATLHAEIGALEREVRRFSAQYDNEVYVHDLTRERLRDERKECQQYRAFLSSTGAVILNPDYGKGEKP